MLLNLTVVSAQNYFQPYPITAVIGSNGSQQRVECSVYDSVLQNVQTYNTPWFNSTVTISANNFGQVAFTTYNSSLGIFDSTFGFIIYDYTLSQFKPVIKSFVPSASNFVIFAIDLSGVNYTINEIFSGTQTLRKYYFRYDINLHEWKELYYYNGTYSNFNSSGYTPTGVRWVIDNGDLGKYWMYDPGDHLYKLRYANCAGWDFTYEDDYLVADGGCSGSYSFTAYDPEQHDWKIFHSNDACSNCFQNGGIFHASGSYDFLTFWDYFGTYDQSQKVFKIDSVNNVNLQGIVIKDRIVAYYNTSITPHRVYFKAYSPTLHSWVTDSSDAQGITGVSISEGTVNWIDASGQHSVGYSDGTGWGNFSTPLQLSFHVTDLSSSTGFMMVHVRNYTIGTDSIKYDFGDGIVSTNNSKVLWHQYKNPGSYSICISDVNGTQSVCQTVSFSQCSVAGASVASSDTLCEGDSLTLNVSGYNGTVQWQSKVGTIWEDEIGTGANNDNYTITPTLTKSYRAKIVSGSCIPAFTNELSVKVWPTATVGTASITLDTICSGQSSTLWVSGYVGTIQWQSFDGSGWVNETGSGSQSAGYNVSPGSSMMYRVILTSGLCSADTSASVDLEVLSFPNPVTANDTICTGGVINLTAISSGITSWYGYATSVFPIHIGPTFTDTINSTTNYYVRSKPSISYHTGPVDTLFGNTAFSNQNSKGLRFSVSETAILDLVNVYKTPGSNAVNIYLRDALTDALIYNVSQSVTTFGKTAVYCGFELNPGVTYNLLSMGSAKLTYNTSNAQYPYTTPGSPVTILGYIDNGFKTDSLYYYFYDWEITPGCNSDMLQVKGVVGQIETPIITSNGPLSFCQGGEVELAVPSLSNTTYQWNHNGNALAGDTLSTYIANTPGRYTVSVMQDTCSAVSNSKRVTIPCINQFDPQEKMNGSPESWSAYFSKETFYIHVEAQGLIGDAYEITVFDNAGREVINENGTLTSGELNRDINANTLLTGIYTIQLTTQRENRFKRIPVIR